MNSQWISRQGNEIFAEESKLPRLPVPSLKQTAATLVRTLAPFAKDDEELAATTKLVEELVSDPTARARQQRMSRIQRAPSGMVVAGARVERSAAAGSSRRTPLFRWPGWPACSHNGHGYFPDEFNLLKLSVWETPHAPVRTDAPVHQTDR